jgi:SAM-dependent methyltransferase
VDYLRINRDSWDKRTKIHVSSESYDVQGFLSGISALNEIELSEMDDVGGPMLLHLQWHFGLDTLSWAREGAIVTGVDLSPVAIAMAVDIRDEARLPGDFVCSDVYSFDRGEQPEYDTVYTSYGSVGWLPDLEAWAGVIATNLRVGGIFYMAEFHPLNDLVSGLSYFHSPSPDVEEKGTYTENCTGAETKLITWPHPLSQVG